jgi:hypothetical protein
LRRSSPDSGFGSDGDADEALEREKEVHAKEKISMISLKILANNRTGKSVAYSEIQDCSPPGPT